MPAYDLLCNNCNNKTEIFVTFKEQDAGEQLERPCDRKECDGKRVVLIHDAGMIWNAGGATRGYGRSKGAPALDQNRNFGHNPPTVGELGLSDQDCRELGI